MTPHMPPLVCARSRSSVNGALLRLAWEGGPRSRAKPCAHCERGRNARIRLPRWIYAIRTDVQRTETSKLKKPTPKLSFWSR